MSFVVPLGFGPDEAQHAFRAYQLSLGKLFPEVVRCASHRHLLPCRGKLTGRLLPKRRAGGKLPFALVHVLNRLYAVSHHKGIPKQFNPNAYTRLLGATLGGAPRTFAHFENTALYSPINYVPAMIVFWIGRHIAEPVIASLFAARLLGGMVWATLITAAVAIAPRWKWLFALVLLVPTALSQGAAISADATTLGVVAVTIAYALGLADRGEAPRNGELALLGGLGVVIGLMKFPLILVVVAVTAIVWPILGTGAGRRRAVTAITLPGVLAAVLWNAASNAYFVPYRNVVYSASLRVYVSEPGQEHYLLTHFYLLPALLWQTAINGNLFKLNGVVGTVGEMGLPEWFAIIWLALFLILAAGSSEGSAVAGRMRAWLGSTLLVYFLATAVALYITWSAVGSDEISGMHGRYFTLVLILAVPVFAGIGGARLRLSPKAVAAAVMVITAVAAGSMFAYTAVHYYGQPPWQAVSRVTSVLF